MKKVKQLIVTIITASLISSCTSYLWEVTDPQECIEITDTSIKVEDLKKQNVDYYVDEGTGRIFVEKSGIKKFKDYSIRTLATPITISVDAATVAAAVVICGVAIEYGTSAYESQVDDIQWQQDARYLDPDIPLR